jgi:hypothetical protein
MKFFSMVNNLSDCFDCGSVPNCPQVVANRGAIVPELLGEASGERPPNKFTIVNHDDSATNNNFI